MGRAAAHEGAPSGGGRARLSPGIRPRAQVDIPPEEVERKGRLMPGNIFMVDFERHQLVTDEEVRLLTGGTLTSL